MGIFKKIFGGNNNDGKDEEVVVFYAEQNEMLKRANEEAQNNFKYFWRELYWEYKRIIPAHNFAMVKIPFGQKMKGHEEPIFEHMWINNINFDGEFIYGELVNVPNQLTNVKKGDTVKRKINEIGDWLMCIQGEVYGGFTIQAMRSQMNDAQREDHDNAWGLDFGNPDEVLLVYQQKEHPENLLEHPMSKNMADQVREFFKTNPDELQKTDGIGHTFLHNEAIAGNLTSTRIMLELGADKNTKSNSGKTALDYAKEMGWNHIVEVLA